MSAERALPKRRALGRGLEALIPSGLASPANKPVAAAAPVRPRDYFVVAIEEIHPNPGQPRKRFEETALAELAASIRAEGIIQPLVVRQRGAGGFELIAGERRWRASQRAGLHEVPVVVREVTEERAYALALVENIQRADLNAIEEAEAYQHLLQASGATHEQLAERVGKDRTTITNTLRLLQLPPSVRELVLDDKLSMGHARALLGVDDPAKIEVLARKVIAKGLSVRATEALVRLQKGEVRPADAPAAKSAQVRDLESRLTRSLGCKVEIHDRGGGKGGRVELRYVDLDELDRLLDRLLAPGRD